MIFRIRMKVQKIRLTDTETLFASNGIGVGDLGAVLSLARRGAPATRLELSHKVETFVRPFPRGRRDVAVVNPRSEREEFSTDRRTTHEGRWGSTSCRGL
jgi:hypothetical protein